MLILSLIMHYAYHYTINSRLNLDVDNYYDIKEWTYFYELVDGLDSITIFFMACSLVSYMSWVPKINFFLQSYHRVSLNITRTLIFISND